MVSEWVQVCPFSPRVQAGGQRGGPGSRQRQLAPVVAPPEVLSAARRRAAVQPRLVRQEEEEWVGGGGLSFLMQRFVMSSKYTPENLLPYSFN